MLTSCDSRLDARNAKKSYVHVRWAWPCTENKTLVRYANEKDNLCVDILQLIPFTALNNRYAQASITYYGDPKPGTSLGIPRTYPGLMIAAENVMTCAITCIETE